MLGTGLALVWRLPPGSRGGRGLTMLGWDRHAWGDFHFYLGVSMSVLVVIHLLLHWGWVKRAVASVRYRFGWIGLLGILILAAIPLLLPVSG